MNTERLRNVGVALEAIGNIESDARHSNSDERKVAIAALRLIRKRADNIISTLESNNDIK